MTNEVKQISNGVNKQVLFGVIFLVVLIVGVISWYAFFKEKDSVPSQNIGATEQPDLSADGSLGANIAEKSQNPISDKLPESNPGAAINPIEGVYQNPFGG